MEMDENGLIRTSQLGRRCKKADHDRACATYDGPKSAYKSSWHPDDMSKTNFPLFM